MTSSSRQYVLFDLDGTLVDTREAVVGSYTRVFRDKLNSAFPPSAFPIADLFAMRPAEVFAIVAPDRIEELHAAYRGAYPQCTHLVKVFDGIRAMILKLIEDGRSVSVVTNKGIERTLIDLSVADIPSTAFAAIITAEDTIERKPHPAPILLGLERLGAAADQAIYVGDGPQDILAARAAGLPTIAVTYGFYDEPTLRPHNPDFLVGSVEALSTALGILPASEVRS